MRRALLLALFVPSAVHAEDVAPPCLDDSEIVGLRVCPPYGDWGRNLREPYVFVDFGANLRHFASPAPTPATRTAARSTSPTTPSGGSDALTFDERVGVQLTRQLYLAFDVEIGDFQADGSNPQRRDMVLAGLGAAGVRGSLGFAALGVELAAGGMEYSYPADRDLRHAGIVEVRARADLWVSPWCSLGALAGASLLERGDWIVGGYLGFHSHAYAGDRR